MAVKTYERRREEAEPKLRRWAERHGLPIGSMQVVDAGNIGTAVVRRMRVFGEPMRPPGGPPMIEPLVVTTIEWVPTTNYGNIVSEDFRIRKEQEALAAQT